MGELMGLHAQYRQMYEDMEGIVPVRRHEMPGHILHAVLWDVLTAVAEKLQAVLTRRASSPLRGFTHGTGHPVRK
jgi:hypothetical protein